MTSSSNALRLFTVDEANALLPRLKPLVQEVLRGVERLREKSETVIRDERLAPDHPYLMGRLQEDAEIAEIVRGIKERVEKIQTYGCLCKGLEQGLLDFPCSLGGEIVFLCWQYGEDGVSFWHRVEDGFAGRRPLLDPDESGSSGTGSYH